MPASCSSPSSSPPASPGSGRSSWSTTSTSPTRSPPATPGSGSPTAYPAGRGRAHLGRPPLVTLAVAGLAALGRLEWLPHALLVAPPSLYAGSRTFATREGGLRVEPAVLRLALRGPDLAVFGSWWRQLAQTGAAGRLGREERAARQRARERAWRAAATAEVVLFLDSELVPSTATAQSQLGNGLGKRVKFVPDDLFRRRWPWLAAGGVGAVADFGDSVPWTVAPPGFGGEWLLATQSGPRSASPPATPPLAAGAESRRLHRAVRRATLPPDRDDARRSPRRSPGGGSSPCSCRKRPRAVAPRRRTSH